MAKIAIVIQHLDQIPISRSRGVYNSTRGKTTRALQIKLKSAVSEIVTAVAVMIPSFWDATPSGVMRIEQRF
jgi:hypothetical protein